ncbi:MAG TPA: methylated-DNA--[protein]-cysteine S-methyltransferase [Desulfomonilaceae bacterium]|nr:methylated-DNA--[protein]-cysteine S-methyltransferase [Desulfomonilaceae bacterium]
MDSSELVQFYHASAVGWLELRVSSTGVRAIRFVSGFSAMEVPRTNEIMTGLTKELDDYFGGHKVNFSVPLDPRSGTAFQREVWRELTRIPYGELRSYGEIAAAVGNPRGARAVGLANKKNRIPIVIPCHRVIKSDGALGGYDSGVEIKRALLELEGVRFP